MSKQAIVITQLLSVSVLFSGALMAFAGSASAASSVIGSGSEQACYHAASTGAASREALASCDAALESVILSPADRAATYANRSAVLLGQDRPEAALADVETALRLDPGLRDAAVNKAGALILLGRYAEARTLLDEVVPAVQGNALERALFNRAVAAESLGDVKAAYHDFKRALELDPGFEAARLELDRFQVANAQPGWQTAQR